MTIPDLEFSAADMRAMGNAVVRRAVDHVASLGTKPVCGDVHDEAFCRAMREKAPEQGSALAPLLDQLFDEYIPRSFAAPSPGYLAYIPGGGVYPAALADFIADTTNRYTGVWQAAPALVQLEANALEWLREWMGFPAEARGLFTTGRLDGDVQRRSSARASGTSAWTSAAACSTPRTRRTTRS